MDDVRIIHGDCLEVMPSMAPGSFDAIVTDPPFGVRSEEWDDMDGFEFSRFSMAWLAQAKRLAPELVVFCTQDSPIIDLCEMLYRRVRRLIWYKPLGSQYAGARESGLWYSFEIILHCHDRQSWSVVQPKLLEVAGIVRRAREEAKLSRSAVDIAVRGKKTGLCYRWEEGACLPTDEQISVLRSVLGLGSDFDEAMSQAVESREETIVEARKMASKHAAGGIDVLEHRTVTKGVHPCEKPLPLLQDILAGIGADYRNILDPFAGSGSTLVACMKAGRKAAGIESDERYIPIIRRRIERAETPLFTSGEGGAS